MTKTFNRKPDPYADIPISISDEYTKPDNNKVEYVCDYCHCSMAKMSDQEWYCNRCSISQYPDVESVRIKSKITTPMGMNLEPCLSYAPDPNPVPKHVEPEGAFKALKDKGIRIKNYSERGGDGRPLKRSRWS
jgi:hypothetical protein